MTTESSSSPLGVRTDQISSDQDSSMPQIQVFVWDAGLALPSIEPDCIAVLAYLRRHERDLPAHQIVIGNDPSKSPTGEYPYIQCSADICQNVHLAGFSQIVSHLNTEHFYEYPSPQDKSQSAQDVALCNFISAKGRQLLDLYLYISYDNYYSATSTAWTGILPWYQNYVIPPAKRRAAQARTGQLGVTSLDVDNVHDLPLTGRRMMPSTASPAAKALGPDTAAGAMIAESERRKRIQVFDRSAQSDVFRLRRLAEEFFDTLAAELQQQSRSYFSPREPRSVDYLLTGYLSCIIYVDVPNKWLATILTENYPELSQWTDKFYERSFGHLPGQPAPAGLSKVHRGPTAPSTRCFQVLSQAILQHIPFLNLFLSSPINTLQDKSMIKIRPSSHIRLMPGYNRRIWRPLTLIGLTFVSTIGLVILNDGYTAELANLFSMTSGGFWRLVGRRSAVRPTRLADLGEAGSFFSALGPRISPPYGK